MASSQILKNANGNVVALENPDTNFSNKTIDISKLEDNLGIGQTWVDVTSQRSAGVTYTNNTGKPIQVSMCVDTLSGAFTFYINGSAVILNGQETRYVTSVVHVIPDGDTYRHTGVVQYYFELRD